MNGREAAREHESGEVEKRTILSAKKDHRNLLFESSLFSSSAPEPSQTKYFAKDVF